MSAEGHELKIRAVRTCFEYNLAQTAGRRPVIHWKKIDEFIEPNWEKMAALASPVLFWRGKKEVAVFGYIRDGELFDHKWMYVCEFEQGDPFLRGERPRQQRGAASPRRLGVTAVEPYRSVMWRLPASRACGICGAHCHALSPRSRGRPCSWSAMPPRMCYKDRWISSNTTRRPTFIGAIGRALASGR